MILLEMLLALGMDNRSGLAEPMAESAVSAVACCRE